MTAAKPYANGADMWLAFDVLATNKTPASNGQGYHAQSTGAHIVYSPLPRDSARKTRSHSLHDHAHGSLRNRTVINSAEDDGDPFCGDFADWPIWKYSLASAVLIVFSTSDRTRFHPSSPTLCVPGSYVLTIGVVFVSMEKTCGQDSLNSSGILSQALRLRKVVTPSDRGNKTCNHTVKDNTSPT